MLQIEKWAKDKPFIIAIGAPQLVIAITKSFDILSQTKTNGLSIEGIQNSSPKEWLSLYYRRKHLTNWFFSEIGKIGSDFELPIKFIKFIESDVSIEEKQKIMALNGKESLKNVYNSTISEIKSTLPDPEPEEDLYLNNDSIKQPELLFLLKILIPCVFLYGELPLILFKKARSKDIDALDKLLRLDKTLICDRRISEQFAEAASNNKSNFDLLNSALQGSISGKISIQKAKYKMAGFISLLSERLECKLLAPEIKSLFDAVSVDSGIDALIDPDLPNAPEAFAKAVQRERNFWKKYF